MKNSIKARVTKPPGSDMTRHQEEWQQHPPSSGATRAIQRNRRGPMRRERFNTSTNGGHRSNDRGQANPRKNGFSRYNLTTHLDQDDREILIESALGGYSEDYNDATYRTSGASSGIDSGGSDSGSGRRRRSYAPLRGYDILSEEERIDYTLQPESIFKLPKSWPFSRQWTSVLGAYRKINEYVLPTEERHLEYNCKRLYFRLLILAIGIGICIIAITNKYGHQMSTTISSVPQSKETDVDINEMIAQNIFEENDFSSTNSTTTLNIGDNRTIYHIHISNLIKNDETLDIGYRNGEDDDMNLNLMRQREIAPFITEQEKDTSEVDTGERINETDYNQ